MLLVIYLVTVIICFFKRNSKYIWIGNALVVSLIFNTSDTYADFYNYNSIYNYIVSKGMVSNDLVPYGWVIICRLFQLLGLNYRGATIALIFITFFLINSFIRFFDGYIGVFWGLFMIFPSLVMCIQIRFFLAVSIVVFFMRYLFCGTKTGVIKYALSVVVASLIHYIALAFLVLCAIPLFEKMSRKLSLLISGFFVLIFGLMFRYSKFLASLILPELKLQRYIINTTTPTTFRELIVAAVTFLFALIMAILLKREIKKGEIVERFADSDVDCTNKIIKAISLIGVDLLLMYYDANFYRPLDVAYILLYILFSKYCVNVKWGNRLLYSIIIIAFLFIPVRYYIHYNTIILPLFSFDGFHGIILSN